MSFSRPIAGYVPRDRAKLRAQVEASGMSQREICRRIPGGFSAVRLSQVITGATAIPLSDARAIERVLGADSGQLFEWAEYTTDPDSLVAYLPKPRVPAE